MAEIKAVNCKFTNEINISFTKFKYNLLNRLCSGRKTLNCKFKDA